MPGQSRDLWLWIVIGLLTLLHVDFWAWNRIHPLLGGWIPYHLVYGGVLTLVGALFFFLWGRKGWPDPPESLEGPKPS